MPPLLRPTGGQQERAEGPRGEGEAGGAEPTARGCARRGFLLLGAGLRSASPSGNLTLSPPNLRGSVAKVLEQIPHPCGSTGRLGGGSDNWTQSEISGRDSSANSAGAGASAGPKPLIKLRVQQHQGRGDLSSANS